MFITIKANSKNRNSLQRFSKFITKRIRHIEKVCLVISSIKKTSLSKKRLTVLKSPHVNKTAQEQFEITSYELKFNLYSYQNLLLLLILKRIKNAAFHDLKVSISLSYNSNSFLKSVKSNLNPNKISTGEPFNHSTRSGFLEIYLKFLDLHGEACFKS